MDIQAVIWDMGGVLLRTEDPTPRQLLADELHIPEGRLEFLVFESESSQRAQHGEIEVEEHWEYVRSVLELPGQVMPEIRRRFWAGDAIDEDLVEYVRAIKRSGIRTGLLSNAFSGTRKFIDEQFGIADAFDQIVISAEEGIMKPDRRIYQITLDRLDVSARNAVFIDDSMVNVVGARNSGLYAIHFKNHELVRQDLTKLLEREPNE
jgi:glucose-1-phosphatase